MKSILIVHQGAIGDFILSLPALEILHHSYPDAQFTFLAHPQVLEIIYGRPYFENVLDCTASRWIPLYNKGGRLALTDLEPLMQIESAFVFGRSSSQLLADNLNRNLFKPVHRIDPFPGPDLGSSIAEYQCAQLERLGIPAMPPPDPVIAPMSQDIAEASIFIRQNLGAKDRLVLLHPGSGSREKLWRPDGWLSLIHRLSSEKNLRLALVKGPADAEIVNYLCCQLKTDSPILLENWPLGKLAALVRGASLYLGNDSGITHLAAACGTPTIALFGPTDLRIWGPRGPKVKIVRWQQTEGTVNPLQGESETMSELVSELSLVWKQANEWLGI